MIVTLWETTEALRDAAAPTSRTGSSSEYVDAVPVSARA